MAGVARAGADSPEAGIPGRTSAGTVGGYHAPPVQDFAAVRQPGSLPHPLLRNSFPFPSRVALLLQAIDNFLYDGRGFLREALLTVTGSTYSIRVEPVQKPSCSCNDPETFFEKVCRVTRDVIEWMC
jgi:hypothetical protein